MKHTNYHDVLLPATEVADDARPHRFEHGRRHVTLQNRHEVIKSMVERILRYISLAYNVLHVERAKMKGSRDRTY